MIELGMLAEDDNLEFLEGCLAHKMSRNPPHDAAIQKGMFAKRVDHRLGDTVSLVLLGATPVQFAVGDLLP